MLERACAATPGRAEYAAQLARALALAQRLREALAWADRARAAAPESALTLDTLGVVYSRANRHAVAAELYAQAVQRAPDNAGYRFNLAAVLKFLGRFEAAEAEYEACVARDPQHWRAYPALAQLRRQTPERNHVARLRALLPRAAGNADAILMLQQALAKELEDLGEHGEAFACLVAGKATKRATMRYDFARDRALFDSIVAAFPVALGAAASAGAGGHPSADPIFVFGLPRTGTTVVERILSSHPQVASAGELQAFGVALKRAARTPSPRVLDPETVQRASAADLAAVGAAYVSAARSAAGGASAGRPRFVDKMPLNFLYAGFIARALPQARMVCLRRDPLDTCLSNFRQLFALNQPYYHYAWDLLDCGRYYLLFDALMAHWRAVLPGRIFELRYEDLVHDQEGRTRALLDFCGLPFDPACLRFEDNDAPVATASAVQVRSALHARSIGRARRYERELAPLRALLQEAGVL